MGFALLLSGWRAIHYSGTCRALILPQHDEASIIPFLNGPRRREAADYPCVGSLEKGTSRAVPRFFGITQRVPIAVVVALTGEYFGFVVLGFFGVRFCGGNDRRDI